MLGTIRKQLVKGVLMFGLFKKRTPKRPRLVGIQYRDLYEAPHDGGKPYIYTWDLPEEPQVGGRVFVRGGSGKSVPAVIVDLNASRPEGYTWDELAPVFRYASDEELEKAQRKAERQADKELRDEQAWLNMARRAAGLPTPGRARKTVPDGYQALPPTDGDSAPSTAGRYGNVWWRASKIATRLGRPAEEVETYATIARRWYAIRDGNDGRESS